MSLYICGITSGGRRSDTQQPRLQTQLLQVPVLPPLLMHDLMLHFPGSTDTVSIQGQTRS